jgi:dihydrofolate reductase
MAPAADERQPAQASSLGSPIRLTLVVAVADNGVIGTDGQLPWRLKSDMAHFRDVTTGKPVVMGRKTFASIGKPLKGRTNIVITRDPDFAASGVVAAPSLPAALAVARGDALRRGGDEIAVIGGADVYRQALPIADRIVFTRVHLVATGDSTFPAVDPDAWIEKSRTEHAAGPHDDAPFTVLVFDRTAAPAGKE